MRKAKRVTKRRVRKAKRVTKRKTRKANRMMIRKTRRTMPWMRMSNDEQGNEDDKNQHCKKGAAPTSDSEVDSVDKALHTQSDL